MLNATKVEGVFSADPEKEKDAEFFEELNFNDAIYKNLKFMDATALTLARDYNLPLKVYNLSLNNALHDIALGKRIGTLIS